MLYGGEVRKRPHELLGYGPYTFFKRWEFEWHVCQQFTHHTNTTICSSWAVFT